jgi:DnaA family protein
MKMSNQLTLNIQLRDDATFDNFFVADNQTPFSFLRGMHLPDSERFVYLWGRAGTGCSHLMQACCHDFVQKNASIFYLSLRDHKSLSPSILTGLERSALVCLDDIDAVAGYVDWEEAIFHLYNRIKDGDARLICSGRSPLIQLRFQLPDLASRLSACVVFQLEPLNDDHKLFALQMRAKRRGFVISEQVGKFIMTHAPRDTHALFQFLDKLDQVTLSEKRKLTGPFLKQFFADT